MKHLEVEESDFVNFFEGILLNDQFLNVRELNDQFYLTNKQIEVSLVKLHNFRICC